MLDKVAVGLERILALIDMFVDTKKDCFAYMNCLTTTIQNPMSSKKSDIFLDPKAGCSSEPY